MTLKNTIFNLKPLDRKKTVQQYSNPVPHRGPFGHVWNSHTACLLKKMDEEQH